MSDLTDVVIEDDRWETLGLDTVAEKAGLAALKIVNLATDGREVCVMACSDARIAELNTEFRHKKSPTNVLSWPAYQLTPEIAGQIPNDGGDSFGDIALAFETCMREAQEQNLSPADHVTHLIVHGCLHLLGYDHENDHDAEVMEALEIKALASLGISNPY